VSRLESLTTTLRYSMFTYYLGGRMWTTTNTRTTTASPEQVWRVWSDVSGWPQWDEALEWATIDGPLIDGAKVVLKPKGGPRSRSTVGKVTVNECFSDHSRLPGARLTFTHALGADGALTSITHSVEISGPLTFVWSRVLGRKIAAGLPLAMARLATRAEEQHA